MCDSTAQKLIIKHFKQKGASAVQAALDIALGYAESGNADPKAIPALFQEMLAALTPGEKPAQDS